MSLIGRVAIIAATIAGALGTGGLTVSTGAATTPAVISRVQAGARLTSPDFSCPEGSTCVFQGDDWNGSVSTKRNEYLDHHCPSMGSERPCSFSEYFAISRPGSLTIHGNSTIYVFDEATGYVCWVYNGRLQLDGGFGYFQIEYGINGGHGCNA
jgi:hypothetical protein